MSASVVAEMGTLINEQVCITSKIRIVSSTFYLLSHEIITSDLPLQQTH